MVDDNTTDTPDVSNPKFVFKEEWKAVLGAGHKGYMTLLFRLTTPTEEMEQAMPFYQAYDPTSYFRNRMGPVAIPDEFPLLRDHTFAIHNIVDINRDYLNAVINRDNPTICQDGVITDRIIGLNVTFWLTTDACVDGVDKIEELNAQVHKYYSWLREKFVAIAKEHNHVLVPLDYGTANVYTF